MSYAMIKCGNCDYVGDIEEFSSTPIFGELPHDTFQCPACNFAIKRQPRGWRSIELLDGSVHRTPAAIDLVPVAPQL